MSTANNPEEGGVENSLARADGRTGCSSGTQLVPMLPPVPRKCVECSAFSQSHCPQQSKSSHSSGLCFSLREIKGVLIVDLLPSDHKQ